MIKLIATDLDGTLLTDAKTIDPSFWEIHQLLSRKGIMFMAASGRQYYTLAKQFEPILDDIIVLAENGTMVKYRDEELVLNTLPLREARKFVEIGRRVPYSDVILCGKESAYVENSNEAFWRDAKQYYTRLQRVDDLMQVEDAILKVTLWDHQNAEINSFTYFQEYAEKYNVAVAGDVWLDITNTTANKGNAIKQIQKMFNIGFKETMIFGDYLNDVDMMGVGWHSYAMKNAHPRIKQLARFTTKYDNNNNGVVRTISEIFKLEEFLINA